VAFKGWSEDALVFYEGLEADNSKAFWTEHKDTYEREVKAPMEALLADLQHEFGESRLFRPYRDTRFSRDKVPYKTSIAARIGQGYVQLSADGLFVGAGMYHMAPDQLARYRAAVVAEGSGKKLVAVVDRLTTTGLAVHAMESLKTAPRGYPKEHPRIELLRLKGLVASRSWEPAAWLQTPAAKTRVVEVLRQTRPLLSWLETNVGASTDSPDDS
jgi:uncharacterized protein (TIGR02453 family)